MDALFAESRDDPPLAKNQTPVAGAIYWEKSLFHRMKRTILRFMTLEAMMQTDQGKAVSFVFFSVQFQIERVGSRVVSVLDTGSEGPGFKSQPRRCRVTVLGKLFTPIVPLFTKQRNWLQPS